MGLLFFWDWLAPSSGLPDRTRTFFRSNINDIAQKVVFFFVDAFRVGDFFLLPPSFDDIFSATRSFFWYNESEEENSFFVARDFLFGDGLFITENTDFLFLTTKKMALQIRITFFTPEIEVDWREGHRHTQQTRITISIRFLGQFCNDFRTIFLT